jgi:hypothetical protein
MTTHDQTHPASYPAAPTTVLPAYDPTPTVPAGTALPLEPTAVTAAPAHAAAPPAELGPARPTVEAFIGTLTGYDEQAIERAFGKEITDLGESPKTLRALAMIQFRRDKGLDPTKAYVAAMELRMAEVLDLFDLTAADDVDAAAAVAAVMGGKAPQG